MLTRETHPVFTRSSPVLDGGHHQSGLSFGALTFPDSVLLGSHFSERRGDGETSTVFSGLGEMTEAFVCDNEVGVCFDNKIMAIYGRETGALNCASFSLVNVVLDAVDFDIKVNKVTTRKVKKLFRDEQDIVIVVNFDDDGEEKIALVMTERGRVTRTLEFVGINEMGRDYSFPEEDEADFVAEGEEEIVGELLRAWRHISQIGGIDFGVGIRDLVLDFVMIDSNAREGVPFHVAQQLDFVVLNETGLSPKLVRQLVGAAFPAMIE